MWGACKELYVAGDAIEYEISTYFYDEDTQAVFECPFEHIYETEPAFPAMLGNNQNISLDFLGSDSIGANNPLIFYSDLSDKQLDTKLMSKTRKICSNIQRIFSSPIMKAIISVQEWGALR